MQVLKTESSDGCRPGPRDRDRYRPWPDYDAMRVGLRNKAVNLLKIRVRVQNSSRWAASKTGTPPKRKDTPICDGSIKAWEKGEAPDFASGDVRKTNPRGLSCAAAVRYKDSGQNKPKPVIFFAIYRLQRKLARFSANLNTDSHQRFRLSLAIYRLQWKSAKFSGKFECERMTAKYQLTATPRSPRRQRGGPRRVGVGEEFADWVRRKRPLTPGFAIPSPLGEGRYQPRPHCECKCRNSRARLQCVP